MKRFLLYLLSIVVVFIAVVYLLDYTFTAVYKDSKPRNKIALAYKSKPQHYDVIFLGSSRANNHFVPELFIDRGYKAYNFGISGSRLEESALLLKLLLKNGTKIKNIIVEVDLNINSNGFSDAVRADFYPYLKDSETIRDYYRHKNTDNFKELYYLPYYRYLKYDARIGFRELFFSAIGKQSKNLQHDGFYALKNTGKNMEYDLSEYSPKKNVAYEYIKDICKSNKIRLIAVTTPMCRNVKNIAYFDEVVKLYPEIYNFENVVTNDDCFSSCGHMNEKGATIFTKYLLDKFFK
ncbi:MULTISPECIES: hypothetical protein [unclassified Flavobacterium]|uniref:hypothetical protein n=1 Tax=unclassified Flavobacterium TaxID=196869 RepID=UPI00086BF393|nr:MULTISPECIES: hypothetical protein [unclassified Flavobacterium]MBN9285841.1 hypothetical protein [Flavobacterium sp.]ODS84247.1 MAG: hypothetical protein ABS44_16640 [Chryseobacterium sp. SCN 40-13]OJV70120.1 MAG: hypothetical protein BGO42_09960 [Flavobacterium sp. 40-81]